MWRSTVRLWLMAVLIVVVSGCSNVPYFPERWFEPSSAPGSPAPATVIRPDLDLTGILTTDRGLTATVTTQLWWKETVSSPSLSRPRPPGWTNVRVPINGALTVTNTGSQPNHAAAAVFYELNAAYPLDSRVCELSVPPDDASLVTKGYCWQLIATATPFSYDHGPPVTMQPSQARTVDLGAPRRPAGVSVDAPEAELAVLGEALRHPSVVALTTNDIRGLGATFRFDRNCPGAIEGLVRGGREQHVNLSSTRPLTCAQLPQLGFGY